MFDEKLDKIYEKLLDIEEYIKKNELDKIKEEINNKKLRTG